MGRTPKPTHLKILAGEREARINRDEPTPSDGPAEVPHQRARAR